jgi:hypothetical protein
VGVLTPTLLSKELSESALPAGKEGTYAAPPKGVILRPVDGGTNYYAKIIKSSAWMDENFLVGAWEEQPLNAAQVQEDRAMGNNIYWSLGGTPLPYSKCAATGCRVNYDIIRAKGMHVVAPDANSKSGSETVAYEGIDEADLDFGPGWSGWNHTGKYFNQTACLPVGSSCGYTVVRFFDTGVPAKYGSPGYPVGRKPVAQGFSKSVLFYESKTQADEFFKYTSILSADSYWMSDPDLNQASQGGCAIFPVQSAICRGGGGIGLTIGQRALPANYAYNVTRLEELDGHAKPIVADIETGCPSYSNNCTTPPAFAAAAWQSIIAGARGILWFQQNFGGPCVDFSTFYDGSNPQSQDYGCQQTRGVTLHDVVQAVSKVNHEISHFNNVLLAPFADNYVSGGKADVSVMAKDYRGEFYVFAASGKPGAPPARDQSVIFHVAGNYTGPVAVYGEGRTLHAVHGTFKDTFQDQDTVHVYKIG